jgi:hypothetical protein
MSSRKRRNCPNVVRRLTTLLGRVSIIDSDLQHFPSISLYRMNCPSEGRCQVMAENYTCQVLEAADVGLGEFKVDVEGLEVIQHGHVRDKRFG